MDQTAQNIMTAFAQYGFRKTSMGDIAKAADRSRQAIYNRFGSKEAVLDWAIETLTEDSAAQALAALEQSGKPLSERLSDAFDSWAGQYVDLLRQTPHGVELIAAAKPRITALAHKVEEKLLTMIREHLEACGALHEGVSSENAAMTLYFASKGLLLTAPDRSAYLIGMDQVIASLVNPAPPLAR